MLLALVVASGCAAGRDAGPRRGDARPKAESESGRRAARDRKAGSVGAVEVVPGWESFAASRAALKRDIDAPRAASHPKKLASLRAAAAGFDALEQGSLDLAQSSFERAVSLHGSDGYAYLGLAYLHHVQGHGDQAAEFADSARSSLPPDAAMKKEVRALTASIDANRGGS